MNFTYLANTQYNSHFVTMKCRVYDKKCLFMTHELRGWQPNLRPYMLQLHMSCQYIYNMCTNYNCEIAVSQLSIKMNQGVVFLYTKWHYNLFLAQLFIWVGAKCFYFSIHALVFFWGGGLKYKCHFLDFRFGRTLADVNWH